MTVALVANIARPISSAISTAFSADSYGLLSSYGLLGTSANPDAVIEALFANSEVGAWYYPSDLTTMFQDRAGTTPVTADGQTVGKILDKSGRGNHAVAPSDAARPLYKTDGTYHWLQFDGVDDSLSTAAIDFTSTDKMSVFSGIQKNQVNINQSVVALGDSTGVAGTFTVYPSLGGGGGSEYVDLHGTVGGRSEYTGQTTGKSVLAIRLDLSAAATADRIKYNKNSVLLTPTDTPGSGGMFGNHALWVGQRQILGTPLNGNIYSLIVRGALSTTQEITDTETWVNQRTGAY